MVTALGAIAVCAVVVAAGYHRARRRLVLDKYAGIPPVKVIPTRPDRRALGER